MIDSRFRPSKWRHTWSPPDLSNIQLQELKKNFNGFGASFAPLTSTTEGWNDPWKLGSLFPSIFPLSRSQKFFFFCSNFNLAIARPLACILHYQLLDLHLPDLMGMGNGNLWVLCRFRSWTPSLLDYNVITSHVGNGGLVYGREKGKTNHTLFCTCNYRDSLLDGKMSWKPPRTWVNKTGMYWLIQQVIKLDSERFGKMGSKDHPRAKRESGIAESQQGSSFITTPSVLV